MIGLGRREYLAMFGADADYDAYADAFIAGAKKARRRWEFPVEPLAGASFPSLKKTQKRDANRAGLRQKCGFLWQYV